MLNPVTLTTNLPNVNTEAVGLNLDVGSVEGAKNILAMLAIKGETEYFGVPDGRFHPFCFLSGLPLRCGMVGGNADVSAVEPDETHKLDLGAKEEIKALQQRLEQVEAKLRTANEERQAAQAASARSARQVALLLHHQQEKAALLRQFQSQMQELEQRHEGEMAEFK